LIDLTIFTVAPLRRPNQNHNRKALEAVRRWSVFGSRSIAYPVERDYSRAIQSRRSDRFTAKPSGAWSRSG
jgi:hypothetical protein